MFLLTMLFGISGDVAVVLAGGCASNYVGFFIFNLVSASSNFRLTFCVPLTSQVSDIFVSNVISCYECYVCKYADAECNFRGLKLFVIVLLNYGENLVRRLVGLIV